MHNKSIPSPFPRLTSPFQAGPLRLRNRVSMSSMGAQMADTVVNERLLAYVGARTRGGVGMVTLGSAPVDPNAHTHSEQQLALYSDAVVEGLAQLAEQCHADGAALSQMLWHGGHNITVRSGHAALAASPIPAPLHGGVPRAATKRDLRRLREQYVGAARRCRDAGLDAVEVQTASDYLLGSFLSPTLNRRTDEYGGSTENRVRLVAELLEAIREEVGGRLAVAIRTSAFHALPADDDGWTQEESIAAVGLLAQRGLLDWISVVAGSHWCPQRLIPPMTTPRCKGAEPAAAFAAARLGVPVMANGRIRTPQEAEAILAAGDAELIALGRPLLADPAWTAKAARGEEERIRPCVSCNQGCWGAVVESATVGCIVNPAAGRELELPDPLPASAPRRIAVVGGGPAGMEAARVAAERGHRVTLHEAGERLGGELRLAAAGSHREEMGLALSWWERELDRLGVEVRRGERLDAAPAGADETLWAVGAAPGPGAVWRTRPSWIDGIPGTAELPHGRSVLTGETVVAGRVLVIDEEGGWPAVSLVESLAADPAVSSVTVVTNTLLLGGPALAQTLELAEVAARLDALGVEVHGERLVAAVEDGVARLRDGATLGPFDAIVLSTGTVAPEPDEDRTTIGDALAPRGIWAATTDAAHAARAV